MGLLAIRSYAKSASQNLLAHATFSIPLLSSLDGCGKYFLVPAFLNPNIKI